VFLKEDLVLGLKSFSDEDIVLRLLYDWRTEASGFADFDGFRDLGSRPLRGAPVEGIPSLDQPVEGTAHFLHWSLGVRSVSIDHIHVVQLESLDAVEGSFNDMLPGESLVIDIDAWLRSEEENLCGDNNLFPLHC